MEGWASLTRTTAARGAAARTARALTLGVVLLGCLGAGGAFARARLDQQNPINPNVGTFGISAGPSQLLAQTFTARRTGKGNRVAVDLEPGSSNPLDTGTIFADIYPADANGAPNTAAAPIGSGSVTLTENSPRGEMTRISLSKPAKVHAGTKYAIVLHSDDGPIRGELSWFGSGSIPDGDQYPRGDEAARPDVNSAWTVAPGQDFFFQTYVAARRRRHR